jgi:glutamate--cysteine ligase catalytic subunit
MKLILVGWEIQVDENMGRAQQRDAVNQGRFYFRREVFTPTPSRATSGATTPDNVNALARPCSDVPSTNGMANGLHNDHNSRRKQRVMENCFPPPPPPDEGLMSENEKEVYAEYTMDEIINGRVISKRYLYTSIQIILLIMRAFFFF